MSTEDLYSLLKSKPEVQPDPSAGYVRRGEHLVVGTMQFLKCPFHCPFIRLHFENQNGVWVNNYDEFERHVAQCRYRFPKEELMRLCRLRTNDRESVVPHEFLAETFLSELANDEAARRQVRCLIPGLNYKLSDREFKCRKLLMRSAKKQKNTLRT